MDIKPMVRNNICLNVNPTGCETFVKRQIEYAKKNLPAVNDAPKFVLVIGCSSGYGLASRIAAAFGYGADTIGISFENEPSAKRTGTPGFYNNEIFDRESKNEGLVSITLNGDAFSDEMKFKTIEKIKQVYQDKQAKIDLIVYSLASPVRIDPKTGIQYKSVIKPVGESFSGLNLNMMDGSLNVINTNAATEDEVLNTVKVMGGEDWELWIKALDAEGFLSPKTRTIAYSYIGPEFSWPIYKNGTIGIAKKDLERACAQINKTYTESAKIYGAWVSINKALVTRSSAVIPDITLYISCLYRVMKDMGVHEGCIEQIVRLCRDRLYTVGSVLVDEKNRIRIDDLEMREDIQKAVVNKMKNITQENVFTESDIAGVKQDFLEAHGFFDIV